MRASLDLLSSAGRYLVSGGSATLLHLGLMTVLIIFLDVPPLTSTSVGAFAGAVFNYFMQFHFTFRSRRLHQQTVPVYATVTALSWLGNNAFFFVSYHWLHLDSVSAQLLTTATNTFMNFFLYRRFVFNEHNQNTLAS